MWKLSVKFDVKVSAFWPYRYKEKRYLTVTATGEGEKVKFVLDSPNGLSHLVNRYGRNLRAADFGYEVEVPKNAVIATYYLSVISKPVPEEELDRIVETGTTKLHSFCRNAGLIPEDHPPLQLPLQFKKGKCYINMRRFPSIRLDVDGAISLTFDVSNVNPEFIRRLLKENITNLEFEMLKGISLLKTQKTKEKCFDMLSRGKLTPKALAKKLVRSAKPLKHKEEWLPI